MDPERVKDILFRALEADEVKREALIREACSNDAELEREVRNLLEAHQSASGFMEQPTTGAPRPMPAVSMSVPLQSPQTIANARIIRKLGEGGFGVVYLAEQSEPVRREVAIKVVRQGMGSREVIARFEAERQALAMMSHPCISRVFDAGTTDDGLPYFVMEYVDGERITDFCERKQLGVRARVRLLEQVCLAVEHAHQKGVIHRDIKPSNVLVSEVDGEAAPKVIDFGIAKAMGSVLGGQAGVTMTAQIVGTPQYMSPEQASFGAIDVDTRSDVYSLGALLYEVMTGEPVYPDDRVRGIGPGDLERMIRDEAPVRPSRRVVTSTGVHTRLSRQLRGDLDWIIGCALEKERARRYPTANALATDLRRYLDGEAVLASPPSSVYRLKKFVSRHRVEVAAGLALSMMLVALVVVSLTTAAKEERARLRAEQELNKFEQIAAFTERMISGIDPRTARGLDTELMNKVLSDAAQRLDDEPPSEAEVEVRLRTMIGRAQTSVAEWESAEYQLRAALALAESSESVDEELLLEVDSSLGEMLGRSGKYPEAFDIFTRAYERRRDLFGEEDERTVEALSNTGALLHQMDRWEEAVDVHQRVLDIRRRTLGNEHEDTISSMNNLATNLGEIGRVDESIAMLREVIQKQTEVLGGDHPRVLMTRNNLAGSLQEAGRTDEAIELLREVLTIKATVLEPHDPSMLISMNNLASALGDVGEIEEAISLLEQAAEIALESTGEYSNYTLTLRHNLVTNLVRAERYTEALDTQTRVAEGFKQALHETHPRVITATMQLSKIYRYLDRPEDALRAAEWCMGVADDAFPPGHRTLGSVRESYGFALSAAGRCEEAIDHLQAGYDAHAEQLGADNHQARACADALASCFSRLGDEAAASRWHALGTPQAGD